ncbi:MAG: hypothetical protein AOA65_2060 [Candidatus Bathyarchaeota archaeon BA1]|nr:MAG: hypothetical protein AOA65_2060 [Candidatus Bathyarchaeota archaeon BA1]
MVKKMPSISKLYEILHESYAHPSYSRDYLAGVFDSEGSFHVSVRKMEYRGRTTHYPEHRFSIVLMATKEWLNIVNYLKATYGGYASPINYARYYAYAISEKEALLRFLDDFIPHLKIKRTEAERLRKSLIAYEEKTNKGMTHEEIIEWIVEWGIT